jgi:dienelactone hydrolase
MHVYGGTMHAFTNPVANDPSFGTVYQSIADKRSWRAMQNFFAEIFA